MKWAKEKKNKVRKERRGKKETHGVKEVQTRRNKKTEKSATAHLRIVMLTPARSNNRHQAQWRNPCWKGGREVVEAESKDLGGKARRFRRRETKGKRRSVIALSYCGASLPGLALPSYVNSCKQRFTPIQPWARCRHPPCCSRSPPSRSSRRACEIAPSKRERRPPPTLIFFVSIKIWRSFRESRDDIRRIRYEPLNSQRKSAVTLTMTNPMRLHVDASSLIM